MIQYPKEYWEDYWEKETGKYITNTMKIQSS